MKRLLYTIILFCSIFPLFGQQKKIDVGGQISLISSQNVYVKFTSTENIQKGDTLFIRQENKLIPVLLVEDRSSISCICKKIGQPLLKVSDEVVAIVKQNKMLQKEETPIPEDKAAVDAEIESPAATSAKSEPSGKVPVVGGRLSIASYSNLTNNSDYNTTRLRYTLLLNVTNLGSPKLSFENYATFSHKAGEWSEVKSDIFNALKIYNLALKYSLNDKINIWAGRKINPKVSNLGAVDGLQMEVNSGDFFFGAIAGSRPDYLNYRFNTKLFEYGAFIGHHNSSDNGIIQSTLAFFDQKNDGKTDRRFAYFQHDNSLMKNINLFISGELDMFKIENGQPKNTMSLTSIYLSIRYRVNTKLSLFTSYDERKNVIYYETFQSRGDSIFESATRQGMQFRVNYRLSKMINAGLNAGYRFKNNDIRSTENISGYLTFNQIPWLNGSATLTSNFLRTGYLNGRMAALNINRDLLAGKIYTGIGYQFVDYKFTRSNTSLKEHIANVDLSWRIHKKLTFSLNCEKTFEKPVSYFRIYANVVKRF